MQGQRELIGSLGETIGFDHGPTSTNATMDMQFFWNDLRNPVESQLPDSALPPPNDSTINHLGHEEISDVGHWSIDIPSSSNYRSEICGDGPKRHHDCPSSLIAPDGTVPRVDGQYGSTDFLSMGDVDSSIPSIELANGYLLLNDHHVNPATPNIDINAGHSAPAVDDCQVISFPESFKPGESLDASVTPASCTLDPSGSHSSNGGYLGHQLSRKRKAIDGVAGQSSLEGTSTFPPTENSAWHNVSSHNNSSSSENVSSDNVGARLSLVVGGSSESRSAVPGRVENFLRNPRRRLNNSRHQDFVPLNFVDNGRINIPSPSPGVRPPLPRNMHPFRPGSASNPVIPGLRDSSLHEESIARNIPGQNTEHPMFLPVSIRNSAQNSMNGNLTSLNVGIRGNAPVSRAGSLPGMATSSSNRAAHRHHSSLCPRRLSEFVQFSLLQSSVGSEGGGQSNNHPPMHSGPVVSSHEFASRRPALLSDRQGVRIFGFPYPSRNVSATRDGRRRPFSEDHFMFFGHPFFNAADSHDRHRDLRLDVDNMSYEELLALEERIGNVSTGLSEEIIMKEMKQYKFFPLWQATEPCCICQEDYVWGDDMGTLDCGHEFHAGCVKPWLMQKNLCPICKTPVLLQNH